MQHPLRVGNVHAMRAQGAQVDDVLPAARFVVDDRMEVDKGIVLGRVLILGRRLARDVSSERLLAWEDLVP